MSAARLALLMSGSGNDPRVPRCSVRIRPRCLPVWHREWISLVIEVAGRLSAQPVHDFDHGGGVVALQAAPSVMPLLRAGDGRWRRIKRGASVDHVIG
ncbi:hypothetical protein GCM10027610_123530 [Dactylosporangium cerinum]